jgi:hypothetical protein
MKFLYGTFLPSSDTKMPSGKTEDMKNKQNFV